MKKFFTALSIALLSFGFLQAQNGHALTLDGPYKPVPQTHPLKFKQMHHGASASGRSGSASYPFSIAYDNLDYVYSINFNLANPGANSVLYFDSNEYINNRYPNTATNTLKWAVGVFDTIVNVDPTLYTVQVFPRALTTISLDSLDVVCSLWNVSHTPDTLKITVFRTDSFTTSGQVNSTNSMTYTSSWDTTIITSTSLLPNLDPFGVGYPIFYDLTTYPGKTYPQGVSFGVRVDFSGDTADHFALINDLRDDCNQACTCSPSVAAFNSFAYFNITSGGQNLSGIDDYPAMDVFYDCDGNGQFDADSCEALFPEDWWIFPSITATVNYTAFIVPDSLHGCPGTSLNLTSNVLGSLAGPFSYAWSASADGSLSSTSDSIVTLTIGQQNTVVSLTVTDANNQTTTTTINISSDGISVSISNPNPYDLASCSTTGQISTTISGVTSGHTYIWSQGTTGTTRTSIPVDSAGTYTVTVSNSIGCTSSASINVAYTGLTQTVSDTAPTSICIGQLTSFYNGSARTNGWVFHWSFTSYLGDTLDAINGAFTYGDNNGGLNTVTLRADSAGCVFGATPIQIYVADSGQCSPQGINSVTFANGISLIPNPTNGNVNIVVNGAGDNLSIKIYNLLGSVVRDFESLNAPLTFSKTFDLSDLAGGPYLVRIQSGERTAIKKLILSK